MRFRRRLSAFSCEQEDNTIAQRFQSFAGHPAGASRRPPPALVFNRGLVSAKARFRV